MQQEPWVFFLCFMHTICSRALWPAAFRPLESELQRKVFFTCLRLCTCKESPDDFMDPEVFGNLLYDNWLMDIPRYLPTRCDRLSSLSVVSVDAAVWPYCQRDEYHHHKSRAKHT
jgi:hypothetical protein